MKYRIFYYVLLMYFLQCRITNYAQGWAGRFQNEWNILCAQIIPRIALKSLKHSTYSLTFYIYIYIYMYFEDFWFSLEELKPYMFLIDSYGLQVTIVNPVRLSWQAFNSLTIELTIAQFAGWNILLHHLAQNQLKIWNRGSCGQVSHAVKRKDHKVFSCSTCAQPKLGVT